MRRAAFALLAVLASFAGASLAHAAWSRDPSTNDPISVAVNEQGNPRIIADTAGNYFVVWHDYRSGNYDIYLQKLDRNGVPQWAVNGVAIYTQASTQSYPQLVLDGAGGVIVAWTDLRNGTYDIYAQCVNGSGTPQWAVGGVPVCTAADNQWHLEVASDGLGGMLLTWTDWRNVASSDVYVQRVDGSGNRLWTANGVPVATSANTEELPQVVSDGAGGAYVAWQGWSNTTAIQRFSASGTPLWSAAGISLSFDSGVPWTPRVATDGAGGVLVAWMSSTAGGCDNEGVRIQRFNSVGVAQWISGGRRLTQYVCGILPTYTYLDIVSDGAGGAFVAWSDERNFQNSGADVYAQKVNAAGITQWANNGVAVCTALWHQEPYYHPLVPDGKGGVIVAWEDPRVYAPTTKVYAQRIDVSGVPQWGTDGKPVSSAANGQAHPWIAADGRGGAVLVWDDARTGALDIRAQRLDHFGLFGDPGPEIVSVKDLANDQGGHVRIKWNRSYRDSFPAQYVTTYGVWRQVTEAAAAAALARGARALESGGATDAAPGRLRAERSAAQVTWWECVGSIPARAEPWYTFVAETFQDSTSEGNPLTTFMVDAHDPYTGWWWTSWSATGYSVDNLPPAIPGGFALAPQGGSAQLTWDASQANDLGGYRVYRGATADFVPSEANRIATVSTTAYTDPTPGSYYKLSAVDIHGNESGFTLATGTTGVGGDVRAELSLARPSPNPARTAAAIRFALPREGAVALRIHDAQGRLVRRLVEGVRPAGEGMAPWDLRDEHGARVPDGLYWARLEVGGVRLVQRLVTLR